MIDFDAMKDKTMETASVIVDRTVDFAKTAGQKTAVIGKITKLKAELTFAKDTARKCYENLGRQYYDTHKAKPDAVFAQTVLEIDLAQEKILQMEKEVAELKEELKGKEKTI